MDKQQQQQMLDLNEASKLLADTINSIVARHVPIPFVLASMALIQHDLCAQHIALTNAMHQVAKGNVPVPFDPREGIPSNPDKNEQQSSSN